MTRIGLATLLVGIVLAASPANAEAAIAVTTNADENGAGPSCSLREAVRSANTDTAFGGCTAGSGADTITIPAGTYVLATPGSGEDAAAQGDLDLTGPTTIVGAGTGSTVIDGADLDRVFELAPGGGGTVTFEVSDLTMRNGTATHGGILVNSGNSTLRAVEVLDGVATSFCCGGVWNSTGATVRILDSLLQGNRTDGTSGGGLWNDGAAIVQRSAFLGNAAIESGGAIYNNSGQPLTVTNATISGNTAKLGGGGISLSSPPPGVVINNVTIVDNTADVDANNDGNGGGIEVTTDPVTITNSIIADNTDASPPGTDRFHDCSGTLASPRYDLIEDTAGCTMTGDTTGTFTNSSPQLEPLTDGARTPELGSPVIDAGSPAGPGAGGGACEATDQRATPRPQGPRCDIGAVERPVTAPTVERCKGRTATIVGTAASETIAGTPKGDVIAAGAGNDRVRGKDGRDVVCGGKGADRLAGGRGGDDLLGQGGRDRLRGQLGKDFIVCGAGKDRAKGGPGRDVTIKCEEGRA